MISTADGEFYPEKNLDRSYKIPKRSNLSDDKATGAILCTASDFPTNHSDTPLQDSYYNYPYDPRISSAYCQNYPYFQEYGNLPGQGFYRAGEYTPGRGVKRPADFSGPSLGATSFMEDHAVPLQHSICNTLKGIKELPKTQRVNIFERTVPDIADESLPKELKSLFQPLYCKLCSVQLSSNQTAIMHYKAKSHEKKIRKWLTDWAAKTGEPLPKRATAPREKKGEDLAEKHPSWYHCDVCDLDLTGQIHAESHYMGRNHQKALLGHKTPAGSGYYDNDGKWVRIKHLKSKWVDEKSDDNFGVDFKKNNSAPSADAAPQQKKEAAPISNYHCKVCNIYTTHPDILDCHFKGQKHAKKLKHLGIAASGESKSCADDTAIRPPTTSNAIDNKTTNEVNLTAYRTPSGLYYCPICNTTINSESSFLQHLNSKGHDKKSQLKSKGST